VYADTNSAKFPDNGDGASLPMSLHQQHLAAGGHFSTSAASSLPDIDDAMAFPPPPPPAQLLSEHDAMLADSDDEFPLPPPPDLEVMPSQAVADVVKPVGRHAGLMQSLSVRLAERGSVQMRPTPPPVTVRHHRMTTTELQQQQPLSHNGSFLLQIHRGVSLRRTISNDRSAPRIPGKR